ncbi:hypothetical protein BASA61_006800 [Batrachochytrium salamandrivorans]|nr:hypothetical protein BASA61_006800 [Batrachochytrium salamandrivorans]
MNQFSNINQLSNMNQLGQAEFAIGQIPSHFALNMSPLNPIQEIAKDILIDRTRDFRNLEIVSDVVDARSQPRKTDLIIQELARGVVPAHPQQIAQALCSDRCTDKLAGALIVQVANDIRYNRRTNEILANLVKGVPHVRRVDERIKNHTDDMTDAQFSGVAQQVLSMSSVPGMTWSGSDKTERKMLAVRDLLTPNAYGQVDPALGVLVHLVPVLAQMRAAGIGSATAIDRLASSGSVFSNAGALNTWSNPMMMGGNAVAGAWSPYTDVNTVRAAGFMAGQGVPSWPMF